MSSAELNTPPLAAPSLGSSYLDAESMAWEPTELEGFWVKKLYENQTLGERTWLMKMDLGAQCGAHAHEEFEQFYVLQGSIEDQEKVIRAGEYVCRAPGDQHTAKTEDGAIALLIYTRHNPA